jgi:hypothetical protein
MSGRNVLMRFKAESENLKNILQLAGNDPRGDERYDKDALAAGAKVELEHTDSVDVAKKIAKDHLDEMPDYYERLKRLEESVDEKI